MPYRVFENTRRIAILAMRLQTRPEIIMHNKYVYE